jgi:hypothetical protein
LIAAQLEKSWETALRRVEACRTRLEATRAPDPVADAPDFAGLADDLNAAWNAPNVTMRARQQLLRALVAYIIADVDEEAREVILTIHWRGRQHSGPQTTKRRAWLPHAGRGPGCNTQHGQPVVRREHRRVPEPHGNAHRSRKNLDSAPCQLVAKGAWDSRLSLRREERRMADNEGRGEVTRGEPSCDPSGHQGRNPRRRSGRSRRSVSNTRQRLAKPKRRRRARAKSPPVSHENGKPAVNVFRCLKKRCIMNPPSQCRAAHALPHCC